MKCPYCGKEMEQGEVSSSYGIFWHKNQGAEDTPDNIPLTKTAARGLLKAMAEGFSIEAHRCPDCKTIIIPHK